MHYLIYQKFSRLHHSPKMTWNQHNREHRCQLCSLQPDSPSRFAKFALRTHPTPDINITSYVRTGAWNDYVPDFTVVTQSYALFIVTNIAITALEKNSIHTATLHTPVRTCFCCSWHRMPVTCFGVKNSVSQVVLIFCHLTPGHWPGPSSELKFGMLACRCTAEVLFGAQ